ncbi:BREX-3 system P-loop-containing protein BrxF [Lysinibacillus capsici]|uniref:BREX-3 system P-loop-containing protein BrxF n=1 Tax=Lysinibacillus capsici TaxID=2115968 RepID=UPI001B6B73FD|nr:BREX-3 system P-loop-containing protein BrxF [Lysinibacillus capsici]MCR6524416.1 BREX-3 system P-loop-containing protein BrxF [Lysinibacillus capsici]
MKPQFLQSIKQNVVIVRMSYYKQIYVYDYKYGNSVKVFSEIENIPYINVNMELSEKLIAISQSKRKYYVTEFLQGIIMDRTEEIICLDYFELLFHPELAVNPFQLLRDISRNKVLVISWRGNIEGDSLIHAEPGHPEYKRQAVEDAIIIK